MEGELHAVLERALAHLVQILREDPGIRAAKVHVFRIVPRVEIGLERLAAEIGGELRIGGVVVQRGLKLRGIEVLTAAADRGDANPGFIEHFLEHFRRLREILLDVFCERLQSVEPEPRSHFDSHSRIV